MRENRLFYEKILIFDLEENLAWKRIR